MELIQLLNMFIKIKKLTPFSLWEEVSGHYLNYAKMNLLKIQRVINSDKPDSHLFVLKSKIPYSQNNLNLVNLINETNYEIILFKINF